MGCRVGMSKKENVNDRIKQWMEAEGHTHWKFIEDERNGELSYDEALEMEEFEAEMRECVSYPGGPRGEEEEQDDKNHWWVYLVWGGTIVDNPYDNKHPSN